MWARANPQHINSLVKASLMGGVLDMMLKELALLSALGKCTGQALEELSRGTSEG
jgi:hypothetical protein